MGAGTARSNMERWSSPVRVLPHQRSLRQGASPDRAPTWPAAVAWVRSCSGGTTVLRISGSRNVAPQPEGDSRPAGRSSVRMLDGQSRPGRPSAALPGSIDPSTPSIPGPSPSPVLPRRRRPNWQAPSLSATSHVFLQEFNNWGLLGRWRRCTWWRLRSGCYLRRNRLYGKFVWLMRYQDNHSRNCDPSRRFPISTAKPTYMSYATSILLENLIASMLVNSHVVNVYAGGNCIELKGPEVMEEFIILRCLIDLCFLFYKKSLPVFLELAGFSLHDIFIEEPKGLQRIYPKFPTCFDSRRPPYSSS